MQPLRLTSQQSDCSIVKRCWWTNAYLMLSSHWAAVSAWTGNPVWVGAVIHWTMKGDSWQWAVAPGSINRLTEIDCGAEYHTQNKSVSHSYANSINSFQWLEPHHHQAGPSINSGRPHEWRHCRIRLNLSHFHGVLKAPSPPAGFRICALPLLALILEDHMHTSGTAGEGMLNDLLKEKRSHTLLVNKKWQRHQVEKSKLDHSYILVAWETNW